MYKTASRSAQRRSERSVEKKTRGPLSTSAKRKDKVRRAAFIRNSLEELKKLDIVVVRSSSRWARKMLTVRHDGQILYFYHPAQITNFINSVGKNRLRHVGPS